MVLETLTSPLMMQVLLVENAPDFSEITAVIFVPAAHDVFPESTWMNGLVVDPWVVVSAPKAAVLCKKA